MSDNDGKGKIALRSLYKTGNKCKKEGSKRKILNATNNGNHTNHHKAGSSKKDSVAMTTNAAGFPFTSRPGNHLEIGDISEDLDGIINTKKRKPTKEAPSVSKTATFSSATTNNADCDAKDIDAGKKEASKRKILNSTNNGNHTNHHKYL